LRNRNQARGRNACTTYLDWTLGQAGGREALGPAVRVVLVARGSPAQALTARTGGFAVVGGDRTTLIYARS
jgi:hypothetical protein